MSQSPRSRPQPPLRVRAGQAALARAEDAGVVAGLVGEVLLVTFRFMRGRAKFDRADFWQVMKSCGPGALPVVTLVNVLVGSILAFVGAVQLVKFGAEIFVADLVGIATVREMAAVMTAIVLCGRTGAAFAARIATMQGNEEIDALRTLGVSPVEWLVLPRVLALSLMAPLLYAYACAMGLIGGWFIGVGMLDLPSTLYWDRTAEALSGRHFILGALKSYAFGALIAFTGCHHGLKAGRTAAAVGEATTAAVVYGIVGVIVIDAVIALCAYVLDI